jgi:putative intracellular protease/amidase
MKSSILFVVTNHDQLGRTAGATGWHSSTVSHPFKILTDAGYAVDFASPKGGKAPLSPSSENYDDPVNAGFLLDSKTQSRFDQTLAVEAIDVDHYQAIYFAGGHGALWDFPRCLPLADLAGRFYDSGRIVAAVGHGPAALINAKLSNGRYLLEGKEVTAFSSEEEEALQLDDVAPLLLETRLRERGARYSCGTPWHPHLVCYERLLTGQNPASSQGLGEALLQALEQLKSSRPAAFAPKTETEHS